MGLVGLNAQAESATKKAVNLTLRAKFKSSIEAHTHTNSYIKQQQHKVKDAKFTIFGRLHKFL